MKKNILITGANGMLSIDLAKQLESKYSIRFLTRNPRKNNEFKWNIKENYIDPDALKNLYAIIHLAGASISEKRWTTKRKQSILSSRVDSAELILNSLKENNLTIDSFISASAIGYYGSPTTEHCYSEKDANGNDFLAHVCKEWEAKAYKFEVEKIAKSVTIVRIGVILAKNAGALPKIILPIKFGMGAALGTGKQYMPWIHIHDLSNLIFFIIKNNSSQRVYNAVAPQHITNYEITKMIGKQINRPILLPNIPKLILKILFGEMSSILVEGSRISSKKIRNEGFIFKFDTLNKALANILDK